MTPQMLESLMMDDALGAVSPEVHMLLEAYLEKDPTTRSQMDHWQGLAARARVALGPAIPLNPPAFPRHRLRAAQRHSTIGRILAASGLAAACLLLGFTFGTLRRPAVQPTPSLAQIPLTVRPAASVATVTPAVQVQGIWSMDRLRAAALRNEAQNAAAVRHDSLWQQLQFGGHL